MYLRGKCAVTLPEKGEVGGATSEWRWPRLGGSSAPRTAKPLKNGPFAGTVPVRSQVIVGGVVQGGDRHPQHSAENF